MPALDAHRIAPKLYQGSNPPTGHELRRRGFDVLVLCAVEHQAPASSYPGLRVLHVPMYDDAWPNRDRALAAGRAVAQEVRQGRRVLVACRMGRNRSGLVTAFALWHLYRRPGAECLWHVQMRRPEALTNRDFALLLFTLPARRLVA